MRADAVVPPLTLIAALVLSGCSLDVETDHRTVSAVPASSDDAGPGTGSLDTAWEVTLDTDADGFSLAGGHLLMVAPDGLRGYDVATGEPTWHYLEPGRDVVALTQTGDAVVLETSAHDGTDGHLVGLDAGSGDQLWEDSDGATLISGVMAADVGGQYRVGDAAAGVVVAGDSDSRGAIGVDARTGDEKWRFNTTDTGPECEEEAAETAGADAEELVLLEQGCGTGDQEVVAVDAVTGEFQWRRPASNNGNPGSGNWTGLAENVALDGANDTPPVLVGPDGEVLFTGENGSSCPCWLYSSGDRAVVVHTGADGRAAVAVDPASGTATVLADAAGDVGYPGGVAAAGGLVYARPVLGPLLPETVEVIDTATGRSHHVPLPHGPRGDSQVTWMGVAGESLIVVRRQVVDGEVTPSGPTTVTAYVLKSAADPVELGGVLPQDWPRTCDLLDGLPVAVPGDLDYEDTDKEYPQTRPELENLIIGDVTLSPVTCAVDLGEDRSARVNVRWVAADGGEAADRVADVASDRVIEVAGADQALELADGTTMMQIGSVIVVVDLNVPDDLRGTALERVAANVATG